MRLIPRKLLFGNPERMKPRISPDGKRIASRIAQRHHERLNRARVSARDGSLP